MKTITPWKSFRIFYSTSHTQNFLKNKYKNIAQSEKFSFQNSCSFIYYLDHAKKYYDQATIAPYELQPVLLFYGMVQLMKAAILTVDPSYPETTQVLAHGVSTRKRKKIHYEFLFDEVKIQKHGLITHFAEKIFNLCQLEGEKFKMVDLLKRVPELHTSFFYLYNETLSYPIFNENQLIYSIDSNILDQVNLSANAFTNYLKEHASFTIENCHEEKKKLFLTLRKQPEALFCSPLQYDLAKQQFSLPTQRGFYSFFPELLVHYLLLYNLSMVCRYETEWWGELFHQYPSNDLPFIIEFLEVTKQKVPYYISLLFNEIQ